MNETIQKLLELIDDNRSFNEISNILNLNRDELYQYINLINNEGYNLTRKYYYDGNIKYKLNREQVNDNKVAIITPHDLRKLEFLIISDIHLSSCKERLDILNKAYDYCIINNIHLILVVGDIIDGYLGYLPKINNTSYEQVDYCIKTYPYDKSIINFLVLGNHDYSILKEDGLDLGVALINKRHDMVVTGYGEGKIYLKNDFIVLRHPLKIPKEYYETYNRALIIKGHTHKSRVWTDYNNSIIYAPTLSDINVDGILPGAIDMNIDLLNGYIQKCYLKNLTYINDKFYVTSENETYFNGKPFKGSKEILYEEEIVKVLKK